MLTMGEGSVFPSGTHVRERVHVADTSGNSSLEYWDIVAGKSISDTVCLSTT